MRQIWVAALVAFVVGSSDVVPAQVAGRQSPDLPPEFWFLKSDIRFGVEDLEAAWAGLPFDSITLERTRCAADCPGIE